MQIAGANCRVCQKRIILASEGKACPHCETVVHLACEPQANCPTCGRPFQIHDKPIVDPIADAIVPRALREPNASVNLALIIAAVGALSVIIYLIAMAWLMASI